MGKLLLPGLLLIHGLIHLIGFVAGYKLAVIKGFSFQPIVSLSATGIRMLALLWLVSAVLFITAAILYITGKPYSILAMCAIILSQLLIIIFWKDAKTGTVASVLLILPVLFAYTNTHFFQSAASETKVLIVNNNNTTTIVTDDMLQHLPPIVQLWLRNSVIVGKPMTEKAYLVQRGSMCIKPGGKWMPAVAEQYFNISRPAFVWTVKVGMLPGVEMTGRDRFAYGKGNMLIKLEGLFTVADGKGDAIDKGTMHRYLGEMCWFPSAALQPYITWKGIDSLSAEATMTYNGIMVAAIFHFDDKGRLVNTTAKRYMGMGKEASLEEWHIPCYSWKLFNGVLVPDSGTATWKLKAGDYEYYRWKLTDLQYNENVPQVKPRI